LDTAEVLEDVLIRDAKDREASGDEPCVALRVSLDLPFMDGAIRLHDQGGLFAEEVDDERPNRLLPAELEASEPAPAQERPEAALGRRLGPAQLAGAIGLGAEPGHALSFGTRADRLCAKKRPS
jgi:hypothetical protein